MGKVAGSVHKLGAHLRRVSDGADQHLRFGLVGDNIGCVAAVDLPDVERAWTNAFKHRQGQDEQPGHHFNKLVHSAFAELGIGRVAHFAGRLEGCTESTLGRQSQTIVGGLAIDEKTVAFWIEVGRVGPS